MKVFVNVQLPLSQRCRPISRSTVTDVIQTLTSANIISNYYSFRAYMSGHSESSNSFPLGNLQGIYDF